MSFHGQTTYVVLKSAQLLDVEEEEVVGHGGAGAEVGGAIDAGSVETGCMGVAVVDEEADDIWEPNLGVELEEALALKLRGTSDSGIFSA